MARIVWSSGGVAALAALIGLLGGSVFWLGQMQGTVNALDPAAIKRVRVEAVEAIHDATAAATDVIDRAQTAAVVAVEAAREEMTDEELQRHLRRRPFW